MSLYKGKGPRTSCGSYRPISLLSVTGKVFAHVLLNRLQPLLTACRRPQQSGFTRGRSTIDAILALRLLSELHREFSQPLHVAYIDIKSAFDSVDRSAFWKALRSTGAPPFLIHLIQDLHLGSRSRVRVNSCLSDPFTTTSGVRLRSCNVSSRSYLGKNFERLALGDMDLGSRLGVGSECLMHTPATTTTTTTHVKPARDNDGHSDIHNHHILHSDVHIAAATTTTTAATTTTTTSTTTTATATATATTTTTTTCVGCYINNNKYNNCCCCYYYHNY